MRSRERALAFGAASLFLVALGVLFVLYGPGTERELVLAEPVQAREERGTDEPAPDFSLLPVREEERSTSGHSSRRPAATVDEPLHHAEHGGVDRSGGRIEFEVVDARGQPLDWRPYRDAAVRVTRHVAGHELDFGGSIDSEHDKVVAAGIGGAGLEPGQYTIELSVGSYGRWQRDFSLAGGETLEDQLRASTYERVVSLHFVDPAGVSIPYLDAMPQYETASSEGLSPLRPGPASVLREPPQEFEITESFSVGTGSRSGSFSRTRSSRYSTDEGRVHLRVVAGRRGKITFRSPRLFEESEFALEDDFLGSGWDDYAVVLHPRTPLQTDGRSDSRDPGRRSLLDRAPRESRFPGTEDPPDPFARPDTADPNRMRFVLTGADSLAPQIFRKFNGRRRGRSTTTQWAPIPLQESRGRWFVDVDRRIEHCLVLSDGVLWFGEPEPLLLPPGDFLHVEPPMPKPVELRLLLPRTLAAYARRTTLTPSQLSREEALPLPPLRSLERTSDTTLTARTSLEGPSREAWKKDGARLLVTLGWQDSSGAAFDEDGIASPSGEGTRSFPISLRPEQIEEWSSRHTLELDARDLVPSPFLLLRAVDARGAGIPWVEASLVPWEEESLAQELRALSRDLAEKGVREELEVGWQMEAFAQDKEWPAADDLEALVAFFGEERRDTFGSPELLTRIFECGAWYDTRAKSASDPYGYLFLDDPRLVEGRTFVLYLWSRSRSDLDPDLRIVFQAEHGITDLGAVTLPVP